MIHEPSQHEHATQEVTGTEIQNRAVKNTAWRNQACGFLLLIALLTTFLVGNTSIFYCSLNVSPDGFWGWLVWAMPGFILSQPILIAVAISDLDHTRAERIAFAAATVILSIGSLLFGSLAGFAEIENVANINWRFVAQAVAIWMWLFVGSLLGIACWKFRSRKSLVRLERLSPLKRNSGSEKSIVSPPQRGLSLASMLLFTGLLCGAIALSQASFDLATAEQVYVWFVVLWNFGPAVVGGFVLANGAVKPISRMMLSKHPIGPWLGCMFSLFLILCSLLISTAIETNVEESSVLEFGSVTVNSSDTGIAILTSSFLLSILLTFAAMRLLGYRFQPIDSI